MATYETVLSIPRPVEETFAFVSDFRHAVLWDPRTYATEKTTDGPIGVGTRFVLFGGGVREDVLQRLRIPVSFVGSPLPYDVVEFDPPHRFVLEGETSRYRYDDVLDFTADGDGGTRLRYAATLELRGALAGAGERLLQRLFQRIGDQATEGLPAAVVRGA